MNPMTKAAQIAVQNPLTWKFKPIVVASVEVISNITASIMMMVSPKVRRIRQNENVIKIGRTTKYASANIADPATKDPIPSIWTLSNSALDAHNPTNSEQNLVMRLRPLYWLLLLVPSLKRRNCLVCWLMG